MVFFFDRAERLKSLAVRLGGSAENALVLLDGVAVGHPGQVITNHSWPAVGPGALSREFAECFLVFEKIAEHGLEHKGGTLVRFVDDGMEVEVFVKILAQFQIQLSALGAV